MFTLVSWSPSLPNPLRCLRIRTWPVCLQSWHVMRPPRLAGGQCGGGPFKSLYPSNMVGHCSSQIWWDWGQPCRIYYSNIRSGCRQTSRTRSVSVNFCQKKSSSFEGPTKSCQTSLDSESNHLDLDLTSANLSITSHLGVGGVRTASGSKVVGWIFPVSVGHSSLMVAISQPWERFHGFAVSSLDLAAKGVQGVS